MQVTNNSYKIFLGVLALFFSTSTLANWGINLPEGVTPISHDIYHLHMIIFWVCVVIGVAVFAVLIYSLIMHRKSRGAVAADFHEHPVLEVLWAIIPFVILVVMAIPATKVLIAMDDTGEAKVTIQVTGHQWKWEYAYLDEGIKFFSNLKTPIEQIHNEQPKDKWYLLEVDNPVVVPIHKKIRFLVTAKDVIHSWWVRELGIKRDAIPGFIHEAWARIEKPGTYRGQCAELCGVNHGYMPIVIKAVTESDYKIWVQKQHKLKKAAEAAASQNWTKVALLEKGEADYNKYCAACHKPDGSGQPPVFPALKGDSIAVGPIAKHLSVVLHGVTGTAMQAFGEQLSDSEIAAIITYERNAWGNNTGDAVQPVIVKKARANA